MPYPVLPPSQPPVIDFPQPEEPVLSKSSKDSVPAGSTAIQTARYTPTPSPPERFAPEAVGPSEWSTVSDLSPERSGSSRAELLGSPVEVSLSDATAISSGPPAEVSFGVGSNALFNSETSGSFRGDPRRSPPTATIQVISSPAAAPNSTASTSEVRSGETGPGIPESLRLNIFAQEAEGQLLPELEEAPLPGEVLVIPDSAPPLPATPDSNTSPSIDSVPPETGIPVEVQPPDSQAPTPPADTVTTPTGAGEVVELYADRQEFDQFRQIFTAEGNVEMRFRRSVLTADRVRVNLINRIAVGEGNVVLTRGDQILLGDRFEYNFVQEEGDVFNASGELFIPTAGTDFSGTTAADSVLPSNSVPLSDRLAADQPGASVRGTGGINIGLGSNRRGATGGGTGEVRRIRFEAERIEFTPDGWVASNVRITNDPFSPPELELRANTATFTRESPTRSVIEARRPRLVFDQGFSLPTIRNRVVLDEQQRSPALVQFGFDDEDRGGLFIERTFEPIVTRQVRFSFRPQFFVQRAYDEGFDLSDPGNYGLISTLDVRFSPTTTLRGNAVLTSLDLDELEDEMRASLRLRQQIGRHALNLEYSYRDRLFNGSLGFQNVQSSLGLVLSSPRYQLGDTGITFNYQVGAQYINANTDRIDLLPPPPRRNRRVSLTRLQGSFSARRAFTLWQGEALPPTPTEGLRFTPNPVVPYVQFVTGLRGVVSNYSSGDTQASLTGSIGLQGQFGHFSRNFLDYTGFNITLSGVALSGQSPFRFDRVVDRTVLSGGIIQQLYGPFRIGFQTSINLDEDQEIDTDYILEYSRRTYAVILRINPVREAASLNLRISDFNWNINPEPFSGSGVGTVEDGVTLSGD